MKSIGFIVFIFSVFWMYSCEQLKTDMKIITIAHIGGAGGEEVENAKEVPADGKSFIEIKVKLISAGGEVWPDTPVEFKTTFGSFNEYDDEVKKFTAKTDGDVATAYLYAGLVAKDDIDVSITFDDRGSDGSKLTKVVTLRFGGLEEGKKLSACYFNFTCAAKNLGAYIDSNIATECFITGKNRQGNDLVEIPEVKFATEVGRVLTIPGATPSTNRYFYIPDPVKKPVDVEPLPRGSITDCSQCQKDPADPAIERCRCGLDSEIINPRDSLVTIIAYTNGEECFEDTNLNGKFDENETVRGNFLGEPFIDVNDNGRRDTGLLGGTYDEPYVESFGDPNNYDEEDGTWNSDTTIWTQTKILLTGFPYESPYGTRLEDESGNVIDRNIGDDVGVDCNTDKTYYFYLLDEYMNPIATNENESTMFIITEGKDISPINNLDNEELNFDRNKYGFEMDDNGEIKKFNILDKDLGAKFVVTVTNAQEDDCKDYNGTEAFTIRISIHTYPGIENLMYPDENSERTEIEKIWDYTGRVNK